MKVDRETDGAMPPQKRKPCFGPRIVGNDDRRFWVKVNKDGPVPDVRPELGPCWVWLASTQNGYGSVGMGRRTVLAHRHAYETLREPIPEGLVIDHLCRNHGCVNPDHMEVVTIAENTRRGNGPGHLLHRLGVCKRGHEISGWNRVSHRNGTVQCRTCMYAVRKQRHQSQKAAAS